MKKYIILFMTVVIAIMFSVSSSAANIELSGAVNYSENTSNGEDEYSREKVRVAHIVKIPKTEKWDGLYGLEYQFKDGDNESTLIPQVGFRYYPTEVIALHLGAILGGHIETHEGFDIKPTIEANIGLGRREVMIEAFTGFDDEKDFCAGVRAGYIFNF